MDQKILKELREALESERAVVLAELKSIAKPDPDIKGEWNAKFPVFEVGENASHAQKEEEADEVEEYEMRIASEKGLESRLLEIKQALERMENNTYGICERCNKEIPIERLRANPEAQYHMEHND